MCTRMRRMSTSRDLATPQAGLAWRILICLALAVFVMRAAVPSGYMAAAPSSPLLITLCNGPQAMSVPVELPGPAHEAQHAGDAACVFGSLALQAVLPDGGLVPAAGLLRMAAVASWPQPRALPAMPAQGPPLGSRAPPVLPA